MHVVDFEGKRLVLDEEKLEKYERRLADTGVYSFRCDENTLRRFRFDVAFQEEVTRSLQVARLRNWLKLAEERLRDYPGKFFINCGNDDPFYIDSILDECPRVTRPEGKVVHLDQHLTMISLGFSNETPWHCHRDLPENQLKTRSICLPALSV